LVKVLQRVLHRRASLFRATFQKIRNTSALTPLSNDSTHRLRITLCHSMQTKKLLSHTHLSNQVIDHRHRPWTRHNVCLFRSRSCRFLRTRSFALRATHRLALPSKTPQHTLRDSITESMITAKP
jgi:hypothetical protein